MEIILKNLRTSEIAGSVCEHLNETSKFHDWKATYRVRDGGIERAPHHNEEYMSYSIFVDQIENGEVVEKHSFGAVVRDDGTIEVDASH